MRYQVKESLRLELKTHLEQKRGRRDERNIERE